VSKKSIIAHMTPFSSLAQIVTNNIAYKSLMIFPRRDRQKIWAVVVIQIFLGALDLAGVVIIGLLGSLTITGVGSKNPGNRVQALLEFLQLSSYQIQIQVTILGLIAASLLTLKTLASLYFSRKTLYFLSRRGAQMSSSLLRQLLTKNLLVIQSRSVQETLFAVTQGVSTVTVGVIGAVVYLISDISLLIILISGLFIADTLIALSTLIVFTLVAYVLYKIMKHRVQNLGGKQAEYSIESSQRVTEVIHSYRELVVKDRREYYANEIGNFRLKLADSTAELSFMQNISKYAIEMTVVIGGLIIAGIQFATQTASHAIAVIAIFLAASTRIAPAVLRVQQGLLQIRGSIAMATPTLELIESLGKPEVTEKFSDSPVDFVHAGFNAKIKVDNVSFTYPNSSKKVLDNVSLDIESGLVVAIVGSSGAGKTTLIDIILGILEPEEGTVEISGSSSSEAIKKWPGAIGYVPQDVTIINGTVAENVAMGYKLEEIENAKIQEALEIAQLSKFIDALPMGIASEVGDRGTKFSGGQRQRLGIARAMFTKPLLVVLDEATSSLDGETEAIVSESIQAMKGKTTVLMIAHRLSTVRQADLVVYLDKGKLSAAGTFEEVRKSVPDFDKQAQLMGL
jgi:ABC-type multidrug transport system fused ATPase/permease subunit